MSSREAAAEASSDDDRKLTALQRAHANGLFIGVGKVLRNGSKSATGWVGISIDREFGFGVFIKCATTGNQKRAARCKTLLEAVRALLDHSGQGEGGGVGGGGGGNGGGGGDGGGGGGGGGSGDSNDTDTQAANGWTVHHLDGQAYYHNIGTGATTWQCPNELVDPSGTHGHEQTWVEVPQTDGPSYYYNTTTYETTWVPPVGYTRKPEAAFTSDSAPTHLHLHLHLHLQTDTNKTTTVVQCTADSRYHPVRGHLHSCLSDEAICYR